MIINPEISIKEQSAITKDEWREWTKTVWDIANISDGNHPAVFPEEIPRRLMKLFSFVGDTVLDPFSGTASTGAAALRNKRMYIGFETNPDYVDIATKRLNALKDEYDHIEDGDFEIVPSSSSSLASLDDDSVGCVITSPPYWNKADYGDFEGNIGSMQYYDDFLEAMGKVFAECYRVLMPGRKICVVTANVNQNTREYGLVTMPIATDLTKLMQQTGFFLINQIIWNKDGTGGRWGSANGQRPIFGSYPYPPNLLFKNVNEYIIICQKPDPKKKNSKAPAYADLFRTKPV
ncbi:site-specific DNA-methyltransferase [Olsenella urininfantis]|uniref:site-specific DNA-methyltransferase n=1 Tax=Olsenella urininfantis TaxID=1871033 RepID=UPI000985AF31|nr:site-specific DNA-methyltransferase [Olsenella urininfantis]